MCEPAALETSLGLASCCLPPPAIPALVQKPGQVPREHLAFCCKEGRIRKSNAPMAWEPREGGREAGGAWQRLGHSRGVHPEAAVGREGVGWPEAGGGPTAPAIPSTGTPQSPAQQVELTQERWDEKVPAGGGQCMPGGEVSDAKGEVWSVSYVSLYTVTPRFFGIIGE